MAFVQRQLQVTIQLAPATGSTQQTAFAGAGGTITLPLLRMSCRIQNSGTPSQQSATLAVYGLSQSLMNQLSTLGIRVTFQPRNAITIKASGPSGFSTVFGGTIVEAWADYDGAPDVPMRFDCQFGALFNVIPSQAISYTGATDVAQILQDIATKMGLGFENNGVSVVLKNPILTGSLIQQMQEAAEEANIDADVINGQTLVISPKNKGRTTANSPVVIVAPPPIGQMIGFPAPTPNGLMVRTVYDPRIGFRGTIEVRSGVLKTQRFTVYKVDHALDCQMPHGQWMSTIYGYSPDNLQPVILPR